MQVSFFRVKLEKGKKLIKKGEELKSRVEKPGTVMKRCGSDSGEVRSTYFQTYIPKKKISKK